ncbi:MAG TPA: alpha/beta fold hydrolase [Steroidobacteraceae bacterium]
MSTTGIITRTLGVLLAVSCRLACSQVATNVPPLVPNAKPATLQIVTIPGASLRGNLEGESTERDAVVVLPPGYASHPQRRYPVVYALHGYSIGAQQWIHEIHVPQTLEGAFAKGAREMIVVLPDSKTAYGGSFYSRSATTGDFETYVVHDVVQFIDSHYRTLANRLSRGLVGHSMGGYGAARLGMRHPEVFGALYIMSGCCLSPMQPQTLDAQNSAAIEALKSPAEAANLPFPARATLATAAAWSPDPRRPPLYLDLPFKDGVLQADVLAKWTANAPLAFFDQAVGNLRQYTAIGIDAGDQDGLRMDAAKFHEALDSYGIRNTFEIYPGTHTSNVAFRIQDHVMPFFSQNLKFE